MAEQPDQPPAVPEDAEETPGYKAPAPKSVTDILQQDTEDESLRKYKETLLGTTSTDKVIVFPEDPRHVIVQKLALLVDGRPDVELDLSGDLDKLKEQPITLKEGSQYRVQIYFYVQHEIVTGLRYIQRSYRAGVGVDKTSVMVGSYGPKKELQSFKTPLEDVPTGMIARGTYTVKSLFTDDDKNEHLKWEWQLKIKKDWTD